MGERERNGKDRKKSRNRQRCRITWNSSGTRRGKKRQLRLRGVQRTPVRDRRWAMQALAVEIIGKEAVQPQKGCRTASLPSNLLHQTLRDLKREKTKKKHRERCLTVNFRFLFSFFFSSFFFATAMNNVLG